MKNVNVTGGAGTPGTNGGSPGASGTNGGNGGAATYNYAPNYAVFYGHLTATGGPAATRAPAAMAVRGL
jgi:hypothetical protein